MFDSLRVPEHDPIPQWYRLDVPAVATLAMSVHPMVFDYMQSLNFRALPMVKAIQKKFHFEDFLPPSGSAWGFGYDGLFGINAPLYVVPPESDGWPTWHCSMRTFTDDHDHKKFMIIRASLSIFFQLTAFWASDKANDTYWPQPQLLTITGMYLEYDMHGGSLSASLTPGIMPFLSTMNQEHCDAISQAMLFASRHMLGKQSWSEKHYFRAECRKQRWLHLTVPGDACGLDPSDYYDTSPNHGYTLSPHNVDTSFQQLCFLFGLAKLYQLAERARH